MSGAAFWVVCCEEGVRSEDWKRWIGCDVSASDISDERRDGFSVKLYGSCPWYRSSELAARAIGSSEELLWSRAIS